MTKPEKQEEAVQTPIPEEVKQQADAAANQPTAAEFQAKLDEMKDALMRTMADADNIRKRAAKEIEEANKYAVSSFAKDLISVLENFQRAIDSGPKGELAPDVKLLVEGVDLTRKELLNVFERRGIHRLEPKMGEKFDHNYHQAVAQVEDHKVEPGGILQVIQAGYVMHDRLLIPAMVTVSKGAPQAPKVDTTA